VRSGFITLRPGVVCGPVQDRRRRPAELPVRGRLGPVLRAGGKTVSIYGHSYSTFWFGGNGFITFDSYGLDDLGASEESLAGHFRYKRISALFDDLEPASGGT